MRDTDCEAVTPYLLSCHSLTSLSDSIMRKSSGYRLFPEKMR